MKKNLKNPWLIWCVALGVAGTGVRIWQRGTAFEENYGLPIPGATASVVLVCVLVMAGAILTMLSVRQKVAAPTPSQAVEHRQKTGLFAKNDPIFLFLMWFSAFCALGAVPILFGHGRALWRGYQAARAMGIWQGGDNGILGMITAVLALLAFFGLLQMGREGYSPGQRGKSGYWGALPALTGCGWLLGTYRNCAADPVLWDYVPLLFAVVAGMLFYIDWAGMSTVAARPGRTLWMAGATVLCSWVALASQPEAGTALLLVSQSVAALAALWCLPSNLEHASTGERVKSIQGSDSALEELENDMMIRRKIPLCEKRYYISTAIAYTSAKPHIGNTYEIVLADAIARYKRMTGYDVYFQTGTDEHGQKIQEKAEIAGITPQEYVDNVATQIHHIWDLMNTTYDKFVRTSDPEHVAKVQKIFKRLYEQGDIYKGTYTGKYCTPCESFWTESQLVDGRCPDCGRAVEDAEEEAYFFRMSKYANRLMEYINDHPQFIQPESRKNEMVNNFLKPGLQDLCVSRTSFSWGIPVDFDPGHVVYVWLDALTNYITFCGYDPDGNHQEHYKKFWPADLHLIGKDIVRFHTIYWSIFLMALGEPLPKQVFGHPWLLVGDGKMSKSTGNVIYADDLVNQFGVDAVRYFVLHEIPFANDGVMTYELIIERINSELANVLGNLVNRTTAMDEKYFGGKVMAPTAAEPVDEELKALALALPGKVEAKMNELKVADAIDEVFALLRRANKYIDETLPWSLAKDEGKQERLGTVLYNLLEAIRFAAVMLHPYLPDTAQRMLDQLNVPNGGVDSLKIFGGMPVGGTLGQAEILFHRIDKEQKLAEIEAWQIQQAKAKLPTVEIEPLSKEQIDFETFCKGDLRAVKVVNCENVKKSNKLLKFTLDDGTGTPRQILSGIAQYYKPEELIGKTLVAIVNLPPRKMMGQESQGMLLSATHTGKGEEKLNLLMVSDAIPAGAKLC